MKASKASLLGLWKNQFGWDKMSLIQKVILFWWSLSFFGLCIEGPMVALLLGVLNFGAASYCVVKYVPEPEE